MTERLARSIPGGRRLSTVRPSSSKRVSGAADEVGADLRLAVGRCVARREAAVVGSDTAGRARVVAAADLAVLPSHDR